MSKLMEIVDLLKAEISEGEMCERCFQNDEAFGADKWGHHPRYKAMPAEEVMEKGKGNENDWAVLTNCRAYVLTELVRFALSGLMQNAIAYAWVCMTRYQDDCKYRIMHRLISTSDNGHGTSGCISTPATSVGTTAGQTSSSLVVASTSGTTSTASTSVTAATKLPSEITGKTVEEIIKEWNAELQERAGKFRKQANAIAEWDHRILQNRDVLLKLEIEVANVVETQANLERQLELIETHQQEVDKALQSMEEQAERIYKDERGWLLNDEAASTRDTMYEQAELIEREMEQMTEQIKSIINSLNASQGGELDALDGMNPLDAVVRILNNQLTSLMWIDEKAEEFSSRIQGLANQGSVSDREPTGPRFWMS
ncbi:hypothetical protein K1719_039570 [Acacia pycnantha]|nr:hypothetical protein K1719_039570 [Acacia pycnantha]